MEFKHLMEVLERYGEYLKTRYQTYAPEATGNLVQEVKAEVQKDGQVYEVGLWLPFYWKYVENGRGAGKFPPPNKILEWIKVKPVIPRPMKNGKLPTEKQLAYLIGRKIANEGTPPQKVFERANYDAEQQFEMSIKMALIEDIKSEFDDLIVTLMKSKK